MYCKRCGKEIADNSTFCQFCGREILKTDSDETEIKDRWTDYIVGFRSRKPWRMIIAGILYALCAIILFTGKGSVMSRIFSVFVLLGLMYIFSCIFKPAVHAKRLFYVGLGIFMLTIGVIGSGFTNPAKSTDVINNVDVADAPNISDKATPNITEKPDVPREYVSALKKAQSYSDNMHMSKKGIYKQLTSEHGEQFSVDAAQYAIDNVNADWGLNALKKAKSYQDNMNMSPNAIYKQLTSDYGEKFTVEEAQYAIDRLDG